MIIGIGIEYIQEFYCWGSDPDLFYDGGAVLSADWQYNNHAWQRGCSCIFYYSGIKFLCL